MTQRLNPYIAAAPQMQRLIDFSTGIKSLEPGLKELVKIRASQINGCAICLDMHVRAARKAGESVERIVMLDAWRESPVYTPRERAALEWTEALTRLTETRAPDASYEAMAAEFSEEEQVALTLVIVAINGFNRIGVGFRLGHPTEAARQAA